MLKTSFSLLFGLILSLSLRSQENASIPWDCRVIDSFDQATMLTDGVKDSIEAFVVRASLRFKADMYVKFFNVDSLFPDSASKQMFRANPYMAEFPQLKGYEYKPSFKIFPLSMMGGYITNCWQVHKEDMFIRPVDKARGIAADTLYCPASPGYADDPARVKYICSTFFGDIDNYFSVYCCPQIKEMYMLGGNAYQVFNKSLFYDNGEGFMAAIIATARTVQYYGRGGMTHKGMDIALTSNFKAGDTIGSLVLEKKIGGRGEPDKYYSCTLYNVCCHPEFRDPIAVVIKQPRWQMLSYWSHSYRVDTLQRDEEWGDIEMIYFTKKNNGESYWPGYVPGFPYYEFRKTIRSRPERREDLIQWDVRGVGEAEYQKIVKRYGKRGLVH